MVVPCSSLRRRAFRSDHLHTMVTSTAREVVDAWCSEGYAVGQVGSDTESPELGTQVQHIIDRADWQKGGYIGFMLAPDEMLPDKFAMFRDSAATMTPATLTIRYQP